MKSVENRDLFPGALEMMILQTLKRSPHARLRACQAHQAVVRPPAPDRGRFVVPRASTHAQGAVGTGGVGHIRNQPQGSSLPPDQVGRKAPAARSLFL